MEYVIERFDCSVIEGHRDKERQDMMQETGMSKLAYPHSKHNHEPAQAVDVAPYPINWNDRERFVLFGGYVKGVADMLRIPIRWGGDWDGDTDTQDQTFHDLPHFELTDAGGRDPG